MKIKILPVGRGREKFIKHGLAEYLKRLGPYARVEVVEVADEQAPERLSPGETKIVLTREAARLMNQIGEDDLVAALAIDGRQVTSEELAGFLRQWENEGRNQVTLVIGGSLGLDDSVLNRANLKLSLSRLTFPHQLCRLFLVEQVYRGFKIIRGEPYHK